MRLFESLRCETENLKPEAVSSASINESKGIPKSQWRKTWAMPAEKVGGK